ncbi:MAG: type II secretion system F family protein [Pseudonocardiaceae bacterium]
MLSLAIAALAAAVFCWPAGIGRSRLGWLRNHPRRLAPTLQGGLDRSRTARIRVDRHRTRWALLLVALGAGLGVLLAGPGGGLAAALTIGTVTVRWRAGRNRRAATVATAGLADALGMLVAELRAGAHVSDAAMAAAIDGHADVSRILSAAAAAARLGGDVPAVLRDTGSVHGTDPVQLRRSLDRLADAWSLADRHGIPLADLLDAVRADADHRVRFAAEVAARLAGPRATAAVLAGLPLLGLALGQAVGAAPMQVLGHTGVGQALLVVGTGLACAGVLWSARLVARAVPA